MIVANLFHGLFLNSQVFTHTGTQLLLMFSGFLFKESWICRLTRTLGIYYCLHNCTGTIGDTADTVTVGIAPLPLSEWTGATLSSKQWNGGPDPGTLLPSNCAIAHHHSQARGPTWPTAPPAVNFDLDSKLEKDSNYICIGHLVKLLTWRRSATSIYENKSSSKDGKHQNNLHRECYFCLIANFKWDWGSPQRSKPVT